MKTKRNMIILILFLLFLLFPISSFAIDTNNFDIEISEDGQLSVEGYSKIRNEDQIEANRKEQDELMAEKYMTWIKFIDFASGIAAISTCGIFIKHCIKFASLGGEHWIVRRNSMIGMLWSGIATVLLGGVTLLVALAFNLFH